MSTQVKLVDVARSAYNAYGHNRSWKTHDGKPMPQWGALSLQIQNAWKVAVHQAIDVARGAPIGTEAQWADTHLSDVELI